MNNGLVQVGQETVHESWRPMLEREVGKPYFSALQRAVQADRLQGAVYPPRGMVLAALRTPLQAVRCVILGQDPYHGTARFLRPDRADAEQVCAPQVVPQACGLAFSVPPGCPPPPSLRVVLEELREDLAGPFPDCEPARTEWARLCRERNWLAKSGDLSPWAQQGVLLLNTALTVRAGCPKSHAWQSKRQPGIGWEDFTDAVCREVLAQDRPVAWLLWGSDARRKLSSLLSAGGLPVGRYEYGAGDGHVPHLFLCAPHPSPANLHASFRGSRPFSQTNDWLRARGTETVDWSLAAPDGGSP